MIDRGEEASAVELAINSQNMHALTIQNTLGVFYHLFYLFGTTGKMQHQFLIVVARGESLPPK